MFLVSMLLITLPRDAEKNKKERARRGRTVTVFLRVCGLYHS